jgi:DNA-binding response OmpR family regulator
VGTRILIVDDDKVYLEAMQEWIALAGFDPSVADTFEDAERAIRETRFDLLIVDIRLGPFNGLQLVATSPIRIPTIVVTGFDDSVLRRDAREVGAAAYVVKPVMPDQLFALIERLATPRSPGIEPFLITNAVAPRD